MFLKNRKFLEQNFFPGKNIFWNFAKNVTRPQNPIGPNLYENFDLSLEGVSVVSTAVISAPSFNCIYP